MTGELTVIMPVPVELFLAFLAIAVIAVLLSLVRYIVSLIMG